MFLEEYTKNLNEKCKDFWKSANINLEIAEEDIDFNSERFIALSNLFDWSTEDGKKMIKQLYFSSWLYLYMII